MLTYHSGVVRGRTAFLTYLAIVVLALLSRDAAAQLAPTGGHYAGRASDTGHGAGQVSPSGSFSAAVPFDFPPARGGLPIPVSVVYGTRGMGAAGVGWDVPLSYVRRDVSLAHRRPANPGTKVQPRITVTLLGQVIEFISDGQQTWVARRSAPGVVLLEQAGQWTLHDGNGLTYVFVADPKIPDSALGDGIWLLSSINGPGGARVQLKHKVTATEPVLEGERVSIDLTSVKYNFHPGASEAKNEIVLNYDDPALTPYSYSILGSRVLVRTRKLTTIEVTGRPGSGDAPRQLSRYTLTYAPDADSGHPRLASVTMEGRDGNTHLPVASYSYGTATSTRVPGPGLPPQRSLKYEKTHSIDLPTGASHHAFARTEWEDWPTHGLPGSLSGKDGYSRYSFIDITGDGRSDLLFPDASGLTLAGNRPADSATIFNETGPLNDSAMTSYVLETRTTTTARYNFDANVLSVHEVWRKLIDVNGDGRLDFIDAAEMDDTWVIYINKPVAGQPGKIEWLRYTIPIHHLVTKLKARGHEPLKTESFAHHPPPPQPPIPGVPAPPKDESKHLALERHTTGIEVESPACFVRGSTNDHWNLTHERPCGSTSPSEIVVDSKQKTYTEWELNDFNADGYPDLIMNSSPVARFKKNLPPPLLSPNTTENGHVLRGLEPAAGDANVIDVAYTHARLILNFSEPMPVITAGSCGVGMTSGDSISTRCKGVGDSPCDDTEIIDQTHEGGRGVQVTQCGIADLNGDGLPDYSWGSSSTLGTGGKFSKVSVPIGLQNISRNEAYSACKPPVPGSTFIGSKLDGAVRDVTGDGIPDRIRYQSVEIGTGAGFASPIPIDIDLGMNDGIVSQGLDRCDGLDSWTVGGLVDIDGDGRPEFVKMNNHKLDVYQLVGSAGPRALDAGRLVQIDNGHGAQTKLTYASAKDDGQTLHQVPFPEIVVASIETTGTAELGGSLAPKKYAYGGAQLMFDPVAERFTFPGYARSVELATVKGVRDFTTVLDGAVVRITDTYPVATATIATPLNEAFGRYLRAGRPRDVTTLAGPMSADPWAMLSTDVTTDARRIAGTHYEWDARAFVGAPSSLSHDDCSDLWNPYGLSSTSMDICATHGFSFLRSTSSWRGTEAPPSTGNVTTAIEVKEIDEFGRPRTILHANDTRLGDDDLCESFTYAVSTNGPHNRVLSARSTRRVANCDGPAAGWLASEQWEYDGLAHGSVSAGFVTSHTVNRHDAQSGAWLNDIREFDAVYDNAGNPTSITKVRDDGATHNTTLQYDPYGLALTVIEQSATDSAPLQTIIERDPVTLDALHVTDPNQNTVSTVFDAFRRPVRTIFRPLGLSESTLSETSYVGFEGGDFFGRRIVKTSFSGAVAEGQTSTTYLDELGRVRMTTASLGGDYGGQEMIVGARTYDDAGRIQFEADAFPSSQDFAHAYGTTHYYNFDGTPHCAVRGNGPQNPAQVQMTTNEAAELYPTCSFHFFQGGKEVTHTADAASLLPGAPQAGVQHFATTTAIGWVLDRSTWRNNTRLEHSRFLYNRLGQRIGMSRYNDPLTPSQPVDWTWQFDSLGQLLSLQEPDSAPRTYKYSDWGELVEQHSAAASSPTATPARRVVMSYDGSSRLLHREELTAGAVDPATVNSYDYDIGVAVVGEVQPTHMLGRLARASTPTGDVSFSYDAMGHVNAEVFTDPQGDAYVQMSEYHADGALAAVDLRLPDTGYSTERVEYFYDSARRVRSMQSIDSLGVQALYAAPEIDAFGRVRSATIGAANVLTTFEDLGRRLPKEVSITSSAGQRAITYDGFDPLGRERGRTEQHDSQLRATTVTYDALGRLSTSSRTEGGSTLAEQTFAYDALGNVLQLHDAVGHSGAALTYLATDRDRLCRIDYQSNPGTGTTCNVVHDALGNIIQQPTRTGERTLDYYASGSIRSIVDQNGTEANFRYDAFGNVQELDLTGDTIDPRRDRRYGGMIERRDEIKAGDAQSFISRNIPGPGFVASRRGANGPWVFELGSQRGNRFFLDGDGAFVQDVDYEPYGEPTSTGAQPGSSLYTTAQWNGGDSLSAFGLSHLGARIYDPIIGRFLSRDPLLISRTAATTNPYAFGFNDPINRSDPSGLDPERERDTDKCSGLACTPIPLIVPVASWIGGLFSGGDDPPAWKVIKNIKLDEVVRPHNGHAATVPAPGGGIDALGNLSHEEYHTPDGENLMQTLANAPHSKTRAPANLVGLHLAPTSGAVTGQVAVSGLGIAVRIILRYWARRAAASAAARAAAATAAAGGAAAYGGLSRAAEFGIQRYGALRNALQGTGLQAHHLIEHRFSPLFENISRANGLSIAVTPAEHQMFTNAWRAAISYGTGTIQATKELVLGEARRIYADYPIILKALGM